MKLHRYVDHQRLHIVTKDVISLSISVLLLFRHYISHKITFGAPSSGGVFCSACGAFICLMEKYCHEGNLDIVCQTLTSQRSTCPEGWYDRLSQKYFVPLTFFKNEGTSR